jgi:hypothetical protein
MWSSKIAIGWLLLLLLPLLLLLHQRWQMRLQLSAC